MHITSEPGILYFGTPVVLISTTNKDGSYNLAPMSSAFWLGWRCLLGLAGTSKTTQNIMRSGECILNLPSVDNVAAVKLLARTTGSNPVPERKVRRGYRFMRLPPALSVIASSAPLPSPSHRARPWFVPVIHVVQPRRRFAFDHAPPDTSRRRARRTAWMAGHRVFGRTPVLRRAMPGPDGKQHDYQWLTCLGSNRLTRQRAIHTLTSKSVHRLRSEQVRTSKWIKLARS